MRKKLTAEFKVTQGEIQCTQASKACGKVCKSIVMRIKKLKKR